MRTTLLVAVVSFGGGGGGGCSGSSSDSGRPDFASAPDLGGGPGGKADLSTPPDLARRCADECVLGATSSAGTCQLWDDARQMFVASQPAVRMHDRARDYDRLLRAHQLVNGAVVNAVYTDATRTQLQFFSGTGDAALWTGTALAAQAWRYRATGAPDALLELKSLVATEHLLFNVSGEPASLARLALPSADPTPLETTNRCTDQNWHCNVAYHGQTYDWLGHLSRDAYTGVMLGYYLAYEATDDESVRAPIRQDVVQMVLELMKQRQVPADVTVVGIPVPYTLNLENVILSPSEMQNGRLQITLGGTNQIRGAREFFPDFSVLVSQVTGVSPPVPRPSSAIMLGAFFQEALYMTDGVPGMATTRQQIHDYYDAHADNWLTVAEGWRFSANCGNGYYANHIAFIMAYVYARLEKDARFLPRIRDNILDGQMWSALKGQKSSYFAYLWGGTRPAAPDAATLAAADSELSQFPVGPRVHVPQDHSADARYLPHDATCTSEPFADVATLAVEVGDRPVEDFLWQRAPWRLKDAGNLNEVFPGVDYLAAYWAGRAHGFITDDAPNTCTRFAP